VARQNADRKKEEAGEDIQSNRMHVTHASSCNELRGQKSRASEYVSGAPEEFTVEMQRPLKRVLNDMPNGAAVIDVMLPAL
jgi:hypothetical protein